MKEQLRFVGQHYHRGDLVRFTPPGQKSPLGAQVEWEARERAGWYYVREHHSGDVHLVQWQELEPVHE